MFFQKSHFSPLNFIFLARCLQSTKKWFRARNAFGLTIHHPAQNKNEIHLQKKRTRETGAQVLPFGNRFQGVILLNKSSTSAWLEIILLANTKQLFPLFDTLLFFWNPQTFRVEKPLQSGRTKMDFHLRNDGDPSSIGPANRRWPGQSKTSSLV